jgi:hypothetical protein
MDVGLVALADALIPLDVVAGRKEIAYFIGPKFIYLDS